MRPPAADLDEWVRRARRGDPEAQTHLVRATQDRLFRFCFYLCGDRALAQDLCQDAFIRALEKLSKLKDDAGFTSWLLKIAKNLFLDHVRSPRSAIAVPLEDLAAAEVPVTRENRDVGIEVREALQELPPHDRLILLLVDVEERSYAEAAEVAGVTEATLRFRLHHIRKAFALVLKRA